MPTSHDHRSETRDAEGFQRVLWALWLTYGAFYFCRTNIAAAVPGIQEEFDFTKEQIGYILGSLKLAYGFGQFVNGQLAERLPPRVLLAIGMLCSAALTVLFGFLTALYFFIFVWACNGYMQALGWTPCMRVAANWFPPLKRGKAIGIIGTGYQVTAALTFIIAGTSASWLGWRGALYVPAALLVAAAIHMLFFLEEAPKANEPKNAQEQAPAQTEGDEGISPRQETKNSFRRNILVTLSNPALWMLAVSLGFLNACRYGFLDWGLTHIKEVQETDIGTAAFKYAVLPIGGIAGSVVSGWATDRFFESRRAPVICGLLVILGLLTLVYDRVVHMGMLPSVVVLFLIGFAIYGPQVLLVGTAPMDLARHGASAAAVGFVNFVGYMGAFSGDVITGTLVDYGGQSASENPWKFALLFWAGCAFAAAVTSAILWNATARQKPS